MGVLGELYAIIWTGLRSPWVSRENDNVEELMDRGFRYAMALTGDPDQAADVLQDAWVAVLQAGGSISAGYVFAAIRSRVCDRARRPRLLQFRDPSALPEPATVDEPETDADDGAVADLGVALARLRDDEREALFLVVVEQWSVEDVATHQQRPRGTVLSALHRARAKLRSWLGRPRHDMGGRYG